MEVDHLKHSRVGVRLSRDCQKKAGTLGESRNWGNKCFPEMLFGSKMNYGHLWQEGTRVTVKGKKQTVTLGSHLGKMNPHNI